MQLHVQQNHLYRIQPRYNPNVNDWWMCDIGRYENGFVHAPERIGSIKRRSGEKLADMLWPEGLKAVHEALAGLVAKSGPSRMAFVLSPFLTCEEAYLLAIYAKTLSPDVLLALLSPAAPARRLPQL